MRGIRPRRAVALVVALAALAGPSAAQSMDEPLVGEYVRALGLAASGEEEAALVVLGKLSEENPAWIAVHHAVALVALSVGEEAGGSYRQEMFRRVRKSRRDVGASVAYSVFQIARGRTDDAHRMLLSAVTAGARSPLLPPLLLGTSPDPEGLATWMDRRAGVLPSDPAFAAMRAAVLMKIGRARRARRVIDDALDDAPQDPELLALRTELLRAAGREAEACRTAQLAAGMIASSRNVPEVRVPGQLVVARAFVACGRLDDAQRVLTGLGSLVTPPGTVDLAAAADAVAAELDVAREQPLQAMRRIVESRALPLARSDEALTFPFDLAQAVLLQAHGQLGLKVPDARALVGVPLPTGTSLAERSLALSALPRGNSFDVSDLVSTLDETASALRAAGLDERGARLRVLAAYGRGDPARLPSRAGSAVAREDHDATLRGAVALAGALLHWEAGDAPAALRAASPPPLEVAGAPGQLLAAVRVIAGKAALASGDPAAALSATREGVLDLQEADRSQKPVPPELVPLVERAAVSGDLSVELAGIAFRAARASGHSVREATATLVDDLSRAVRGWSMLPSGWPSSVARLEALVPASACLVISTGIGGDDSVALRSGEAPRVGARDGIAAAGPCTSADAVLWLGPARAPGGLTPRAGDDRPLVRIVGLTEPAVPPSSSGGHRLPERVGPGRPRSFRTLVERLAGDGSDAAGGASAPRPSRWPAFTGRGIRSARCALASGWLVQSAGIEREGWAGPESIGPLVSEGAATGEGLVALGLMALGGPGPERGAWVLAEAAIDAGRPWSLLSRVPLTEAESNRLSRHLPDLATELPSGLRRLIAQEPDLAQKLDLWTLPAHWRSEPPRRLGRATRSILTVVAIALAVLLLVLAARAAWRRRKLRAARRDGGPARVNRPGGSRPR